MDPDSEVLSRSFVIIPFKFNFIVNFRVVNFASTFQEFLVELLSDIELNGVITSGNGLHIPLNVVVGLYTSDVVNINDHKEGDENTHASVVKTENLSLRQLSFTVGTSGLNEEHGLLVEATRGSISKIVAR